MLANTALTVVKYMANILKPIVRTYAGALDPGCSRCRRISM